MKRKWILVGAIMLPLALFGATRLTQAKLSWKPRLVATNPDGPAILTWDSNGQAVQIAPTDRSQHLKWGDCSLPASKGSLVPQVTQAQPSLLELRQSKDDSDPNVPALTILAPGAETTVLLEKTSWNLFGVDYENFPGAYNLQGSGFSPNWSQVFIVSSGAIYTWSTKTGKLLRRVVFDSSKDVKRLFVSFSPDRLFLLAPANGGIFDARTGRKKFSFPASHQGDWSSDGRIFWTEDKTINFFDARTGRILWRATNDGRTIVRFASQLRAVVLPTAKSLELRDERTGNLKRSLPHRAEDVSDFAVSPDGSQIWASYGNGQIWSWRLR